MLKREENELKSEVINKVPITRRDAQLHQINYNGRIINGFIITLNSPIAESDFIFDGEALEIDERMNNSGYPMFVVSQSDTDVMIRDEKNNIVAIDSTSGVVEFKRIQAIKPKNQNHWVLKIDQKEFKNAMDEEFKNASLPMRGRTMSVGGGGAKISPSRKKILSQKVSSSPKKNTEATSSLILLFFKHS